MGRGLSVLLIGLSPPFTRTGPHFVSMWLMLCTRGVVANGAVVELDHPHEERVPRLSPPYRIVMAKE